MRSFLSGTAALLNIYLFLSPFALSHSRATSQRSRSFL